MTVATIELLEAAPDVGRAPTEAELAIWRRLTDEQRRRVIEADWVRYARPPDWTWAADRGGVRCCPLGAALPETGMPWPGEDDVAEVLAGQIGRLAPMLGAVEDDERFAALCAGGPAALTGEAMTFILAWDRGAINPGLLVDALAALQGGRPALLDAPLPG